MKKKPDAAAPLPTPTKEQADMAATILSRGLKPLVPLATSVLSAYLRADLNVSRVPLPCATPPARPAPVYPYETTWTITSSGTTK